MKIFALGKNLNTKNLEQSRMRIKRKDEEGRRGTSKKSTTTMVTTTQKLKDQSGGPLCLSNFALLDPYYSGNSRSLY